MRVCPFRQEAGVLFVNKLPNYITSTATADITKLFENRGDLRSVLQYRKYVLGVRIGAYFTVPALRAVVMTTTTLFLRNCAKEFFLLSTL